MVCQFLLYNKVNQLYVYIYPYISSLLSLPPSLPIPPLQVVTKHPADLPVLCGCFPLAIYFTFGSVYMSVLLSHFVPAYPSPSPCPQVHSPRLRLYFCPAPRFMGIYPEKTVIQKESCTTVFTAALFTVARTWKQPKCPLTDEWIKKMWHIYIQWNITQP